MSNWRGKKEKRLTLVQIKQIDEWPIIEKILNDCVETTKLEYPGAKFELKETKYSVQLWIDGKPEYELDAVDLIATAGLNNLN